MESLDKKKTGNPRAQLTLHRGTWTVLGIVFVVWLLLAFPGKRYAFDLASGNTVDFIQHGWPMVHFESASSNSIVAATAKTESTNLLSVTKADLKQPDGRDALICEDTSLVTGMGVTSSLLAEANWANELSGAPYWTESTNWSLGGSAFHVRWIGLLGNISILLVTLLLIGAIAEFRFRKRGLRVSMKEMGMLTVVAAVICMYYGADDFFSKHRTKLEDLEVVKLYDDSYRYDTYPEFLVRMFGRKYLPNSKHFRSAVVDFSKATEQEREQINKGFRSLKFIRIAKLSSLDDQLGDFLFDLRNVEELTLIGPSIAPKQWRALKRMKQLETLRISKRPGQTPPKLGQQFFKSICGLRSLATLELDGCQIDTQGLDHLSRKSGISRLNIDRCNVDDRAIEMITKFDSLTYLSARDAGLSDEHLERLKEACPRLLVVR